MLLEVERVCGSIYGRPSGCVIIRVIIRATIRVIILFKYELLYELLYERDRCGCPPLHAKVSNSSG